jgi:hypothetical protein
MSLALLTIETFGSLVERLCSPAKVPGDARAAQNASEGDCFQTLTPAAMRATMGLAGAQR